MSFATITLPRHAGAVRAYASSVGRAARRLLAALSTVKRGQSMEAAPFGHEKISPEVRQKSVWELYRMASQCDSVMPTLAAELRCFASRD